MHLPAISSAAEQVSLETDALRFSLTTRDGSYEINDKHGEVTWRSNPFRPRFGEVTVRIGDNSRRLELSQCQAEKTAGGLEAVFHPVPDKPNAWVRVRVIPEMDGKTLSFTWRASDELQIESTRLLDDALWVADSEQGYAAVPVREGLLIPADSGKAFSHRFDTYAYEGCHIEMFGVVKKGATALVTWHDPYAVAELKSIVTNDLPESAKQILSSSLILGKASRTFQIHFGGRGDYVAIAKQYRQTAAAKGYLVRWQDKLKARPQDAKLFGAINYKLWSTLDRRMDDASSREESVRVNWTFDEAAQIAEHLKSDLKLEKVLFSMGGWIHRGYDNQHPDILPAAPECGGNEGLAECARRVRRLGYLFALHDNYQDMYRDAPSWDEDFLMKRRDGSLAAGGKWAGGRAYLTCSPKAVELAKRPQNLPAVLELTRADAYFIDTTYAAGLMECFDPRHPLTRQDDMKWKQAISDYTRDLFGMFGSECGREWAIPHSDFFEGMTGVSGRSYHDTNLVSKLGAVVVPLFEIVYRDCIAMYGKYGYNPSQAGDYVLHHLAIGRPLHHHNIPSHLYWKNPPSATRFRTAADGSDVFTRADNGWTEGLHVMDRFVKNTYEILSPLNELTATMTLTQHSFLTSDRNVQRSVFGEGATSVEVIVNSGEKPYEHRSKLGQTILLPRFGFCIESPTFVAFHALKWAGRSYDSSALFTLRSLDGNPVEQSGRVRVFHGFGDDQIHFAGKTFSISKEEIIGNDASVPTNR